MTVPGPITASGRLTSSASDVSVRCTVVLGPAERDRVRSLDPATDVVLARSTEFPDGEQLVRVDDVDRLRGRHVLVTQSTCPPQDRSFMTALQLVEAVGAARPASVTCFLPYLCYQRQDRRTVPGEALSGELVSRVLAGLGVRRIITVDQHSTRPGIVQSLGTSGPCADLCRAWGLDVDVVVSPDRGGGGRCAEVARLLDVPVVVLDKDKSDGRTSYGDLAVPDGSRCLVVDDLCSSGSTLKPLCEGLAARRATVSVFVTHLLVDAAVLRARIPQIDRVGYSDSCGQIDAPVRLLPSAVRAWQAGLPTEPDPQEGR